MMWTSRRKRKEMEKEKEKEKEKVKKGKGKERKEIVGREKILPLFPSRERD